MKKNRFLIIVLLTLVVTAVYYFLSNRSSTTSSDDSSFAIKDTASITKIFLADKSGKSITLSREIGGRWLLNGVDEPKTDLLRVLLKGIFLVEVKSPVAKAAYNNVIKMLAATGIKCEIYLKNNKKPAKVYYVGGHTEDAQGTFMMIENASSPFITQIPGFNGYLTPRYSVDLDAWKSTRLFRLDENMVKRVSISYLNYPEKSFILTKDNGSYSVESPYTQESIKQVDTIAAENYLAFYHSIHFESRASLLTDQKRDSILRNPPSIQVKVTDNSNQTQEVAIYPMARSSASLAQSDSLGQLLKYDLDRMYGFLKPQNEFVTIQHSIFDKLLRQFNDFDSERNRGNTKQ